MACEKQGGGRVMELYMDSGVRRSREGGWIYIHWQSSFGESKSKDGIV